MAQDIRCTIHDSAIPCAKCLAGNNPDSKQGEALPPERIWIEPYREGYPVPTEFYASPIAFGIEYVRASTPPNELLTIPDRVAMNPTVAARHSISDRGPGDVEYVRVATSDTPVVAREAIELFRDTAMKAHVLAVHKCGFEECEWAECEERKKMISELSAATTSPETPVGEIETRAGLLPLSLIDEIQERRETIYKGFGYEHYAPQMKTDLDHALAIAAALRSGKGEGK